MARPEETPSGRPVAPVTSPPEETPPGGPGVGAGCGSGDGRDGAGVSPVALAAPGGSGLVAGGGEPVTGRARATGLRGSEATLEAGTWKALTAGSASMPVAQRGSSAMRSNPPRRRPWKVAEQARAKPRWPCERCRAPGRRSDTRAGRCIPIRLHPLMAIFESFLPPRADTDNPRGQPSMVLRAGATLDLPAGADLE